MNFKQIEAFRAVMVTGSMTGAAAQLYTTQPNISRLVQSLEKATGFPLFERHGGRVIATPEADALYREVARSFAGLDGIAKAAATIREHGTGAVRIGTVSSIAIGLLPEALLALRKVYPDVPISVEISDSPTVAKWTANGLCDIGLVAYVADDSDLKVTEWHREQGVCIVPDGHRLARKKKITVSDLDGEDFISLPPGDGTRRIIDHAFRPDKRKLIIETAFAPAICTMVATGLGVSIVNPLVSESLNVPGIKQIPFKGDVVFSCFALLVPHAPVQQAVKELYRCLNSDLLRRRGRAKAE